MRLKFLGDPSLWKYHVCGIWNRAGKYGSILYFDFCNGKWLKTYAIGFILLYLEDIR
jgi:hypothetical protein